MKFNKEILQELTWGSLNTPTDFDGFSDTREYEVIERLFNYTSRWSIHYTMIFKCDGKLYSSQYSIGATEQQDQGPYEYDPDEIECDEVEPYEATVTKYRKIG